MNSRPEIKTFALGPWETNCYLVTMGDSDACWIVDAGFQPDPMIDAIQERGLKPERLILTHAHLDHIGGVNDVLQALGPIPIAIHEDEQHWLSDPQLNLSAFIEMNVTAPSATDLLNDGQILDLQGSQWEIRHTPGHSPGGITLYCEAAEVAIVGDTLFRDSVGRTDFPTSDGPQMFTSIRERLMTLPDATRVLPGHGPETTIGRERESNMFREHFS